MSIIIHILSFININTINRRRPRYQMRASSTPTILLELSKRLISKNLNYDSPLPQDCYEYLLAVDQIDNYSYAPNVIDETTWQTLCRMRRNKIESEFKIKACGLQLAEMEATIHAYSKEISHKKFEISSHDEKLFKIKEAKIDHSINRTVQLVMKRGMVEIFLSGQLKDFESSILLHLNDVLEINQVIRVRK